MAQRHSASDQWSTPAKRRPDPGRAMVCPVVLPSCRRRLSRTPPHKNKPHGHGAWTANAVAYRTLYPHAHRTRTVYRTWIVTSRARHGSRATCVAVVWRGFSVRSGVVLGTRADDYFSKVLPWGRRRPLKVGIQNSLARHYTLVPTADRRHARRFVYHTVYA